MSSQTTPAGASPVELSIIVPVFNAREYLAECVGSILGQSFDDFELLLVDDGSTDGSGEIAERLGESDYRIRVFHLENGGPSWARNAGLLQARGRYIQFVDADDLLEPDCCRALHEMMELGTPDLVICGATVLDQNMVDTATIAVPVNGVQGAAELLGSLTPAIKATLLHYVWNKWYRLSLIREKGLLFETDVRLGEDFLFNCEYWKACQSVGLIDQSLYRYCKRDASSLTGWFRVDELARRRRMEAGLFDLYSHFGLRERCESMLEALVGAIALDSIASVVLPGAPAAWRERVSFVRGFVESEYRSFILEYAASDSMSAIRRLEVGLVRLEAPGALTAVLWSISRLKGALPLRPGGQGAP